MIFDTVVNNVISSMTSRSNSFFHNAFSEGGTCSFFSLRELEETARSKSLVEIEVFKSSVLITFVSVELYRVKRKVQEKVSQSDVQDWTRRYSTTKFLINTFLLSSVSMKSMQVTVIRWFIPRVTSG